jgi:hypothetical protein
MSLEMTPLERIDALYDAGRDFAEHPQLPGASVVYQFDQCAFDRWRKKVNEFLYDLRGCDDLYYQRFSKEVVTSDMRSLEVGLRILAALRDDMGCELRKMEGARGTGDTVSCGHPSASYH